MIGKLEVGIDAPVTDSESCIARATGALHGQSRRHRSSLERNEPGATAMQRRVSTNARRSRSGRPRLIAWHAIATVGVVLMLPVLAACGGGGSSSGSSSGKPAVCQDLSSFNAALHDLTNLNISQGVSSIQSAVQNVQQTGKTFVNSAKAQFKSDAQDLQNAVNQLESTVQSLRQQSSISNAASELSNAVQNVVNTGTKLVDEVTSTCK